MLGNFVLFVAAGFAAQFVDGAIGMAYGLSGTTVILSFGIPPATASASVHAAEVFTTGTIGLELWPIIAGLILGSPLPHRLRPTPPTGSPASR